MPVLELEGSDIEPRDVNGEVIIGSGSQATWRIPNVDLAARHFSVKTEADGASRITPASAQNVVILNGQQVPPSGTALKSGDVIGAGAARFFFLTDKNAKRPNPTADSAVPAHLIDNAQKKGYTLRKRVVQIGREIGCSIVLKDPTVSRFHADVRSEGGEYVLYSMGSAGTRVNGQTVNTPQQLQPDDQIQVGETTFTFKKGPMPPGVRAVQFEDHDDVSFSRRSTQLAQNAVTGELPDEFRRRKNMPMIIGAVVVLVVLIVAYVLFKK